jgi:hypothetical protein
MMRRRRPVLGTVARTAVVAGTAQAVAGRVNHNQQQKWAAQAAEQAPAPPAAPAPPPAAAPAPSAGTAMDEKLAQLQQLGTLRDQGILTDAEFEAQKAAILAS